MKDIKYQEQTRQSTFAQNSIALPDESSKILAAAKDQVNRMEKNRQDELQYRQQYLRGLQENAWESRKNRADNYRLEQDYNKDYIKALNVRLAADKNKIKLQAQAQQDLYKNLANFSNIALSAIQAVDQKVAEDASAMGKYLGVMGGLTPDSILFKSKAYQATEAGQTAINSYVNSLRLKGVDQQTINSLQNMSGRQLIAAQQYALSTAGDNSDLWIQENSAKVYNVEGLGPISLQEALSGSGSPEVVSKLLDQMLFDQIKGY